MQKATKGSAGHLRKIIDTTNARLSAMLSLGNYQDVTNALIIYLVMDKLDAESQIKWEESVDYTQLSSWENCSEILSRRCQTLEARETKSVHTDLKQTIKDVHPSKPKTFFGKRNTSTALAIEHTPCSICHKGGHEVVTCPRFTRMSSQEHYSAARAAKLCLVCLRKGHWLKQCSAAKCTTCNHSHHILLHRQDDTGSVSNEVSALENKESSSSTKK